MFACLHLSLHVDTYNQNAWSVTSHIEYISLFLVVKIRHSPHLRDKILLKSTCITRNYYQEQEDWTATKNVWNGRKIIYFYNSQRQKISQY